MKSIFTLLLLFPFVLAAQNIKIKKDTVYVEKEPFCLLKDKGMLSDEFTILDLQGKELILTKMGGLRFYTVYFFDSKQTVEKGIDFGFQKKLIRELIDRGALSKNGIDSAGLEKFIATNSRKFSEEEKREQEAKKATVVINSGGAGVATGSIEPFIVERDRNADLFIIGGTIKQDFKQIGAYKQSGNKTTILDIKGTVIAEVTFQDAFVKIGKAFTFVDRREYIFETDESHNMPSMVEEFANFLISKRYL